MKAAILTVGTEILFGEITNTNSVFLSRRLNDMGIDVLYHYTVGDNPGRLAEIIGTAFKDCDIVITTGGLGPTQDDMTKEIACQVMGDHLVMHDDILDFIRNRLLSYKTEMTENNIKQALLPSRCRVFFNDAGTAPGFALEDHGRWIACMPGPPKEMTRMFEKSVVPWLEELTDGCLVYKEIRTFGIGESDLETVLLPVIDGQTDPTVATYAKNGECAVRVASKRKTREEAEHAIAEMIEMIEQYVGEYIYSTEGEEFPVVVGNKLMSSSLTIAAAESCTGGMFGAALTDIPGISAVFDRSLVTYSNQAKIDELGVKPETLEQYGAVSEQTAIEMAEGVRLKAGTDIGISVTGIAGPDGDTEEKHVGLVYIGLSLGEKCGGRCLCRKIDRRIRERQRNRRHAVLSMFDMIYRNVW
ncbi:MAG: competence/damage-inducible protein A [Clostridia bacterium]|nr:competence/damage-inducible protein A [Clostridia bacterium]